MSFSIMDPVTNVPPLPQSERLRNVVRHYVRFFERQEGLNETNFTRRFAARLRELAEVDEATFQRYLREGDPALHYDARSLDKPWRTFFRYDGQRFCGTAMYGYAWPVEIAGRKPTPGVGAYFFGLWEPVIEALRDGRIEELADMKVTPGTTQDEQRVFVRLEDGSALAWAASEAQLQIDMFDDLFSGAAGNGSNNANSGKNGAGEAEVSAVAHAKR